MLGHLFDTSVKVGVFTFLMQAFPVFALLCSSWTKSIMIHYVWAVLCKWSCFTEYVMLGYLFTIFYYHPATSTNLKKKKKPSLLKEIL